MSLKITHNPSTKEFNGGSSILGSGGHSAIRDTSAKMLVGNSDGDLIPCNYQYWFWGDDHGSSSGNNYIPCGVETVLPEDLGTISKKTLRDESCEGEEFDSFIRNLMDNPPEGVHFIRYDGFETVTMPQEYWSLFFIKIPKKREILFVHNFSLCAP